MFPEEKLLSKQFRNYSLIYLTLKKYLVECRKSFIISKTNTGPLQKNARGRHRSNTKTTPRNLKCSRLTFVGSVCKTARPYRIVFENYRCSWNRSSLGSDLKICLFSVNFAIFIAHHQG